MPIIDAYGMRGNVVFGREERKAGKDSRYLADNIASSSLEIVKGAGHLVMMERPEEFNQKVEAFLYSVSKKDA